MNWRHPLISKVRLLLAAILVMSLFSIPFAGLHVSYASGNIWTVNDTNDSSTTTCVANAGSGGPTCQLRDAIGKAASGDTIVFSITGTIALSTAALTINNNLTITGPGAASLAIDGNNRYVVFTINSGTVAISGLTIQHAEQYHSGDPRGAIDVAAGATLTVSSSVITNNSGGTYGSGGIYNLGTLTVNNNTIISNNSTTIDSGGGIYNAGTLTITNSTLSSNASGYYGGGIYNAGTITTVSGSIFSGNSGFDGGAISNYYGAIATISGSTFSGNSGSAIYNYVGTITTISNSAFSGNSDSAITNYAGTITTISNSAFSGNSTGFQGGGIYNSGTITTISGSTFSGNSGSAGGGIYNYYGAITTISGSTFSGNSGGAGGGISNENGTITIISGSTFSNNTATYNGGGLYYLGYSASNILTISNSTFVGNQAAAPSGSFVSGIGGALYLGNSQVVITGSTLSGNIASVIRSGFQSYGGGIYNSPGNSVTISNSTIANNAANSGSGGAIYNDYNSGTTTTIVLSNSTVSRNTATLGGGGIYNADTVDMGSTIVAGNTVGAGGTGPDINGFIGTLGNNLIGNTSGGSGFAGSDQQNMNPLLTVLGGYGGPTQTMALQTGSPAVSKGNCNLPPPAAPVTTDQRGVNRGTPCDVGAFEGTVAPPIDTIGIFRSGTFYLRLHNSTGNADLAVTFSSGTKPYPVVGDWTGAGFDTVGVYDQSNGLFTLCTANNSTTCANAPNRVQFVLGNPNDQPIAGHWNASFTHFGGGVFRPSNGLIYLKNALTTGFADYTMVLGIPGDVGLAGDWNGDGLDSLGVYRPSNSTFYLNDQTCNCSLYGTYQFAYGIGGDAPVVGDWIGQGHDGVGLFRRTNGYTYLRNSLTTGFADNAFVYGIAGDVPLAGHWQLTYPPVAKPSSTPIPVLPTGVGD